MAPVWIVIKVKFGDELRRLNALIHDEEFNFDMAILTEKICSLFDFAPDVDFTLTYVDEDGDVVTLCDDDDLHDVASQCLDPLRITINLKTENLGGSSSFTSSESCPQDQANSKVVEILKLVPEVLHDGLLKLLLFLASKTENSTVVINELVEVMLFLASETADSTMVINELMELQTSHLIKLSESKDGLTDIKEQERLRPSKMPPMTYLEALNKNEQKGLGDDQEDVEFGKLQPPRNSGLNVPYLTTVPKPYMLDLEGVNESCSNFASCYDVCRPQLTSEADSVPKSEKKGKEIGIEAHTKSVGFGASNPDYLKRCLQDSKMPEICGTKSMKESCQQGTSSGINECAFKGMGLSSGSIVHSCPYASRIHPFKDSYKHGNGFDSLYQTGVQCDHCGVYPITMPHFKSKVDDYHLCKICFEETGRDPDSIKIDHPTIARNSSPFKGFQDHLDSAPIYDEEPSISELDSCFVRDLNVYDGTIVAPSTTFTKIWRMRNNGGVVWPQGSQFLWTGGDWLSNTISVEAEIPVEGLVVGEEVDIAVDFTAPGLPGQYVSYWRMASPSGQKFGQLVWVYIEVDDDDAENSNDLYMPPPIKDREVVKPGMGRDSELHENHFARVVEREDRFSSSRDQVPWLSKSEAR